jgi:recombination protein RecR
MSYPKLIENVIEQLNKLPGIGRRSAERIVFWLLSQPAEEARLLSDSVTELKQGLRFCSRCNNFSETEVCRVCADESRDPKTLCVVENPKDLLAIERSGSYKGRYHVLLGTISPTEGRGPEHIKMGHLFSRVAREEIDEIIIATDPDNEGEMTALYIVDQLKGKPVKLSRIGLGIPMGSALEFADMSTLNMSLNSRRVLTQDSPQ